MKSLLSLLFLFGGAVAASAQSAPSATPPQCPSGPLLNPVPDNIQWTVTYSAVPGGEAIASTPASPDAKPTPKPAAAKKVLGQSVGEIRHVVTTYGNGIKMDVWKKSRARRSANVPANNSTMDVWERGGSQYVMSTGWKMPVVSDASPDDLYEALGWISSNNFQTIVKSNGVDCMVFRDKILPPGTRIVKSSGPLINLPPGFTTPPPVAAIDPESLKVKAVAVVELDRRLPAVVQIGEEITTFQFQPLDSSVVLAPPPEVEAAITARIQQTQASVRHSVQP